MVARVRLVQGHPQQLQGRHREIDVDGDPAAKLAEVVAEGEPGLVTDDLQVDAFGVRQIEQAARPGACLGQHGRHRFRDALGGDVDRPLPALLTFRERPIAWEQLSEPLVRGREDVLAGVSRPDAVAPLDLVGVGPRLAGQHACIGAQPGHLVAQPAVRELVEQRLRRADERSGLDERLRLDGCGELRRAEVRIDHPVGEPPELQPEPEVALRGGHRRSLST